MYFKGSSKPKKSWKEFGDIDDLRALQVSSNVYMFNTALQMAGINYVPNNPLDIKQETFNKMRYYFRQFGLGVSTGIDLPNESIGQVGRTDNIPDFYLITRLDSMIHIRRFSLRNIFPQLQMAVTE